MATVVITNGSAVINSVDLSDHVKSIVVNYSADTLEDTAMGATFHTKKAGLLNGDVTLELYQDYASSKTDQTLFGLVGAAAFSVVVKANASAGTNNTYTFSAMVIDGNYNPINGAVGALEMTSVKFVPASGCTLTRS